jgi:hypothetical protein
VTYSAKTNQNWMKPDETGPNWSAHKMWQVFYNYMYWRVCLFGLYKHAKILTTAEMLAGQCVALEPSWLLHNQGLIDSFGEEGMQLPFIITFLSESEHFFYK